VTQLPQVLRNSWAERTPVAFETAKKRRLTHEANALDGLIAAGKIREIDREHVIFIVRTLVHPGSRVGLDRVDLPTKPARGCPRISSIYLRVETMIGCPCLAFHH
jgi:hypothetical protein